MGTDLIKYDQQAADIGLKLSDKEIVTPRIVIVQPTSLIAGEVGQGIYYMSMTGESFKTFRAVIFTNFLGKIMFNPNMKAEGKDKALCGSYDRVAPSPRFENPKATSCFECKFNKPRYSELLDEKDPRSKLECPDSIGLVGMRDDFMPFLFTVRKTSEFPIRCMLQSLKLKCKINKTMVYQFMVTFTLKEANSTGGRYFVPNAVVDAKQLSPEQSDEFKPYFDQFRMFNFDQVFAEEEATTGGSTVMPEADEHEPNVL